MVRAQTGHRNSQAISLLCFKLLPLFPCVVRKGITLSWVVKPRVVYQTIKVILPNAIFLRIGNICCVPEPGAKLKMQQIIQNEVEELCLLLFQKSQLHITDGSQLPITTVPGEARFLPLPKHLYSPTHIHKHIFTKKIKLKLRISK